MQNSKFSVLGGPFLRSLCKTKGALTRGRSPALVNIRFAHCAVFSDGSLADGFIYMP